MTSKIQNKPKSESYLPYEAIHTTTTDHSNIKKDNFSELHNDHVDLQIEKGGNIKTRRIYRRYKD